MKEDILIPDAGTCEINEDLVYNIWDLEEGWSIEDLPRKVSAHGAKHQNQYLQKETYMSCTVYGLSHTINNTDKAESTDAKSIVLKDVIPKYPQIQTGGWSMQWALTTLYNNKYIYGWASVPNNMDAIVRKIREGRAIYTGSMKIDYTATRKNNNIAVFVERWPWHVFCADEADLDTKLVSIHDSSGEYRWNNGHFYIRFEDFIKHCYSKIIVITENEKEILKQLNDKKYIEKAIANNITNGERLWWNATRWEVAVMIARAYAKHTLIYQEGIELAKSIKAFNWQREWDACTRWECMLMVASMLWLRQDSDNMSIEALIKLWVTNGQRREYSITREEATIMITRAFTIKHGI